MKHETRNTKLCSRSYWSGRRTSVFLGGSEQICRETVALSPWYNRALGSTAILPAFLSRPTG